LLMDSNGLARNFVVERFSMRVVAGGRFVELHGPADITEEATEAIVNAANSYLMGGGGVDGAIHNAGGPAILEECRRYVAQNGNLPAGRAMLTRGGRLTAKYVIHTVGPVYRGGSSGEQELLASCYRESIRLAERHGIQSLAFPSISTGAFGYPVSLAAHVAVQSVLTELEQATHVGKVRFVLFDISTLKAYSAAAEKLVRARPQYALEKAST